MGGEIWVVDNYEKCDRALLGRWRNDLNDSNTLLPIQNFSNRPHSRSLINVKRDAIDSENVISLHMLPLDREKPPLHRPRLVTLFGFDPH